MPNEVTLTLFEHGTFPRNCQNVNLHFYTPYITLYETNASEETNRR